MLMLVGSSIADTHRSVSLETYEIGGCPFYMGAAQFEYWSHTQLIIDVVPGRGASFSLEAPEGVRFLTRSRLFSDGEVEALRSDPDDMTKRT